MSTKGLIKGKTVRKLLSVLLCLLMSASLLTFALADDADLMLLGEAYTRDEIAAMPSVEGAYTYSASGGERTDTVKGVLLEVLLADVDDDAVIDFQSVDNWAGISSYSMTKGELVELNAMLAYMRLDGEEWVDYSRDTDNGPGFFALYVEGMRVAHAVNIVALAGDVEEPEPETPPVDEWIGDASPDEHDFRIVGMVEQPGYFTMAGLIEYSADFAQTKEYSWLNMSGSVDKDTFTGIYFEDLLEKIVTLDCCAAGIIVTAEDGYSSAFTLDDNPSGVFWTDIEGNKMMLAWNGTESRTDRNIVDCALPRIAIGQKNADDVNRSSWTSRIIEIRVSAFVDMRGFGWAAEAVEALAGAGIVKGMGDNRFDPAGNLTRSQFITMLGRALCPDAQTPSEEERVFPDVDYDSWYGAFVKWAVDEEIVFGYEDGTFGPELNLTVEHMLLMAERAGLTDVPDGVDAAAPGWASRAQAAVVVYALMAQ